MENLSQFVTNNLVFIFLSIGALFLLLIILIILLYLRIRRAPIDIFDEKEAKSLEDILVFQSKTLKTLDKDIQELYTISNKINNLSLRGIHKVGLVRFNPFKDVGGDQSFSLALLNGKDNGVVISSLYTREGTRAYAKAIASGQSEKYPLSEEEKKAIKIALKQEKLTKKS